MDNQGRGITYYNNKIVFVNNALPKEDVDIKLIIDKKKYSIANVKIYHNFSELRIKPKCKYFNICGGCQLQHLSYQNQIEYKKKQINEILKSYNQNIDIVFDKDFYYRDKLTLQVNKQIGLYELNSNNIIKIDKCVISNKTINNKIQYLKLLNINKIKKIILKAFDTETMLIIIGDNNIDISLVLPYFEHIYINEKKIKGSKLIANIGNLKYYVSANAFFQVNPYITLKMYNHIKNLCQLCNSKSVLDLYCGCGSISLFIADVVDNVLGIEINKESIQDANLNKTLNNIDNVNFYCSDTNNITIDQNYDTVIVDPPRSGLSKTVIHKIIKKNIKNIIYVSCDPFTLKRDLDILKNYYDINMIKAFDMFPNTYHVECVCVLNRG